MARSGLLVSTLTNSPDIALDIPRPKSDRLIVPINQGLAHLPRVTSPEQMPLLLGVTPEGENIIRNLVDRDCYIQVFPANTEYKDIHSWSPDGIMLSNGPGDPAAMPDVISHIKEILQHNIPLFGICLGQQLLSQACGIGTYKMFNGHRGINHPVKNIITGRCEITSQNHGFSVIEEEVRKSKNVEVTHVNLNDNTIEGIRVKDRVAFSVQYHPESAPGPHDSVYLFDDFVGVMSGVVV